MNFTQPQITEILDEIANGKNGYQHLLQLPASADMKRKQLR